VRCLRDTTGGIRRRFRREAVRLVRAMGRSVREVAAELDVSGESLRLWVSRISSGFHDWQWQPLFDRAVAD
jgi:transposase-like protein